MTPVILLTDAYIANGASAWRIPDLSSYASITPRYVDKFYKEDRPWAPYRRDPETYVRYWAIPGMEGYTHRVGGLEKDSETGAISTEPRNHHRMVGYRQAKIDAIAHFIPQLEVEGDLDADTLMVGWGSTYGHLLSAIDVIRAGGRKVAMAQFKHIRPLPSNTEEVLRRYKNIIVIEQNNGQFAKYLQGEFGGLALHRYNVIEGQPLKVAGITDAVLHLMDRKEK